MNPPSKKTLLIMAAIVVAYFLLVTEPKASASTSATKAPAPDPGIKPKAKPAKTKTYAPPSQGTTAPQTLQTPMTVPSVTDDSNLDALQAAFNSDEGWSPGTSQQDALQAASDANSSGDDVQLGGSLL